MGSSNPEVATRLPCPVCLGVTMRSVRLGPQGSLVIDHCARCGGVWLDHGEVQRLRTVGDAAFWERVEARRDQFPMRCHSCHAFMDRAEEECPACGWSNQIDCPACDQPMSVESHAGLRLDVCRSCKGVWFDHHELKAIWTSAFDRALQARRDSTGGALRTAPPATSPMNRYDVGDAFFDAIFFAPDLVFVGAHAAGHAAGAAIEVAGRLPDVISAAPDAAVGVFEAAGEAAGGVFEVVVGIIAGIFESF